MPDTQDNVIKNVTNHYLQSIDPANPPSPDQVQEGLVKLVKKAFDSINANLTHGQKKWIPPEAPAPAQIAEAMNELYTLCMIKGSSESSNDENHLLAVYCDSGEREGTYVDSDRVLFNLAKRFKYTLTKREYDEVIIHLKNLAPETTRTMDTDLIAVNNGIFDYRTKKLQPFSPDLVFTCKSLVNYVDNPPNPVIHNPDDGTDWDVESWMSELMDGGPEMTQLVWELLGATVRPHVRWNRSAWLYSTTGNNGKGTLCELMRNLVGRGSYASIPLEDFGKDFMLEPLLRAQAIIVDENNVGTFIDKAANLKAVITNDVLFVNRKFKEPIAYQFFGFMVQCLNEMPKVKDKSDSFYRRQLFVPFTKCFTGHERKYYQRGLPAPARCPGVRPVEGPEHGLLHALRTGRLPADPDRVQRVQRPHPAVRRRNAAPVQVAVPAVHFRVRFVQIVVQEEQPGGKACRQQDVHQRTSDDTGR